MLVRPITSLLLGVLALVSACGAENKIPIVPADPYTFVDSPLDVSPDGATIAYLHAATPGQPLGIYLKFIHPDSLPRFLMPYDPLYADPSDLRFSPDGMKAALVRNGFAEINVLDLSTGTTKRVTFTNGNAKGPDWDPSGRYLIYERPFGAYGQPDTAFGFHIVDTETLADRPLLQGTLATLGAWPRWSPDSSRIIFDFGVPTHIYVISPDGTGRQDLTPGDQRDNLDPLWARDDGSLVLFESSARSTHDTRSVTFPGNVVADWTPDIRPFGGRSVIARTTQKFIFGAPDPTQRYIVLYIQDLNDPSGASRSQVTFSVPQ